VILPVLSVVVLTLLMDMIVLLPVAAMAGCPAESRGMHAQSAQDG
jgi:hypothetical protein